MQNNSINISYCLCETNWQKVYLSILSLVKTTKHKINIYITFDNWLKDNIKNLFLDLDRKNDILNIIFVFVDEKLFSKFKMAGFSSPYSFHRLVLPQLCPNVDRILFLTANAICMDDLLTLYTNDLNNHVIACCEDIMYIHDNDSLSDLMDADKIKDIFVTGFSANSIGDLNDTGKVKAILKAIPETHKELLGQIMDHIKYRDIPKGVTLLMIEMSENKIKETIIKNKIKKEYGIEIEVFSEAEKKRMFEQAILNSFITSAVYEMFDIAQSALISKEAVDVVIEISENMHKYPEVFKVFEEYKTELIKECNLNKISSDAFVSQFKNKYFLNNISYLTSQKAKEFAKAWIRKENTANNKKKTEQENQIKQENNRADQFKQINETLNQQESIAQAMQNSEKIKENLNKVNAFGYSKIAGYDEEKGFLKAYLNSLSSIDNCDSSELLNSILFYGPRGNGKTTFAGALAEEFGCRFRKIEITSNKEKALKRLEKELCKAKEYWEANQRNSIILIDECTAFMDKPKNLQEEEINTKIAQLIQEAANKYHATLFMTTNYPTKLDKLYIDGEKIPLFMPLDPPDKENAIEVFKHYIADNDVDFNSIIEAFEKQCQNQHARYSNGQIKNIVELTKLNNNGKINTQNLLITIEQVKPEITQDNLTQHELDKNIFNGK